MRRVSADPRYSAELRPDEINDLIVDSIATCQRPVRAMIDAHDRLYGDGSGEVFLLGPYLDVLPSAVVRQVRSHGAGARASAGRSSQRDRQRQQHHRGHHHQRRRHADRIAEHAVERRRDRAGADRAGVEDAEGARAPRRLDQFGHRAVEHRRGAVERDADHRQQHQRGVERQRQQRDNAERGQRLRSATRSRSRRCARR